MELRTFVSKALLDIIGGVQDAQQNTPSGTIVPLVGDELIHVNAGISPRQGIDFEVAVRVENSSTVDAKLGVVSGFFNAGTSGNKGDEREHSSTLRFRVPVCFPNSGQGEFPPASVAKAPMFVTSSHNREDFADR